MKAIVFDFSRVLLFPKDMSYLGGLNDLNNKLSSQDNYNASDYFQLNTALLERARLSGKDLYMFTSETIQERPEFGPHLSIFKKIYSAKSLGLSKKDSHAYTTISQDIGIDPKEIGYIDDNSDNIQAASEAGLQAILFVSNDQIKDKLGL